MYCPLFTVPREGGGISLDRVPLGEEVTQESPAPFRQRDASEKITVPQTSFAGGKNEEAIIKENAKADVRCECALVISDRSDILNENANAFTLGKIA